MATRAAEWERALREADNGKEPLRDVFIRLFLEADSRLAGVEGTASSVAALQALMTQDANTLINAVVTPLLAQIRAAADMGILFSATSVSETMIGTGVKSFTIPVGMRTAFAPAAQLAIVAADDPGKAMWARKLAYNSETGVLTVDVYSTQGSGLVSSWSITAGIAASMAAHVAVAAAGLVPLGNLQGALAAISAALANDPNFGSGVLAALDSRYTKAETDALLAGRQAATAASQLLAGLTPAGDRLPYFSAGDAAALTPLSGFWRSVLGAADDAAARSLLKAPAAHNPRITGNLRFGARTPIDAIFLADADTAAVCVYDTRLDSDGGTWRSRTQDTLAFVISQSSNRGARRDFPAIAVVAMETTFSQVRIYDAEEIDSNGVPSMWAISSLPVSAQVRRIKAANGFICVASANGLGVVDIPGDGRRVYFADRVSYYTPLGDSIHVSFAKIRDDLTKNIPSTDTKDVDLRVFAGAPIGAGGLPIPTIAVATAAGASIIFPSGEIVDITRSGGYVGVSLDSDTRLRLVTPEGNVEVGPIPTVDVADSAWRAHAWTPTLGAVLSVAGAAEATTRGLLMRSESPTGYDLGLTAHIGPTHNTGWMPPNTRRALFCDSIPMAMTVAAPLADDCSSTAGWTLGAGWSHDATEFDHAGGTAALDRALTGLTAGVRYRARFLIGNRSAGSLAVSLLTAGDEAGALSVSVNGEHVVGFTAAAATDTLRFVPTTDFNGSVQDVRVEVSIADRSIVGRDALVVGAVTAVSTGGIGELRPIGGFGPANGVSDTWTADLDFAGDFCVAFNSQIVSNNTTAVQRASWATSGARWEVRFTSGTVHFDINDGTNGATVSAAVQTTTDYSLFVFVRRGSALEIWQAGVLTATASAAGVGSLANPAAGIRYGARVDGSQTVSSSFRLRGLVIAASAPTAEQVATMYLGGRDIIQPASLCCLGGATRSVARVSRDPITDQVAAAAEGVAVFKGLMRTDRISTETSLIGNNAVIDVAMRGATIAVASPAGGFCYRTELAAVMVESANIGRASVDHEHRAATLTLPGFMSAADKAKLDGLNKITVGLANVDNTADVAKPVSTAQAAAIAAAVRIRPHVPQRNYVAGATWLSSTSAADNSWSGLCWAPELGLFVSVGASGTGNRVMTSPDGITWTARTSAADNNWRSVCWSPELGLLVAVADSGTGDRVMTSPDGITWTTRASAADNSWVSVCWSPQRGLFVAIAGAGTNRVMTSPDGLTWTTRSIGAQSWRRVIWAAELGLFIGAAGTGTANRISTSADGIAWVSRSTPADNDWRGLAWSPQLGLLVATALSGTGNRVMTSLDGINWTLRTSPADNGWIFVDWSPQLGLFVAIAATGVGTGDRVMTSPDGITWTVRTSATDNAWQVVRWSPELGLFCAIANTGTGNRVMTSVSAFKFPYRS